MYLVTKEIKDSRVLRLITLLVSAMNLISNSKDLATRAVESIAAITEKKPIK